MATPTITNQLYLDLLKTFRKQTNDHGKVSFRKAARECKTTPATATKAYKKGWDKLGMAPVRDLIENDIRAAQAALADLAKEQNVAAASRLDQALMDEAIHREEEEAKAREHARNVKTEEGRIVSLGRQAALANLASTVQASAAAAQLIKMWVPYIKAGLHPTKKDANGNHVPLTYAEGMKFLKEVSRMSVHGATLSRITLELERIILGQPTEILGISPVNMTLEEAVNMQKAAAHAAQLIEQRAGVTEQLKTELKLVK